MYFLFLLEDPLGIINITYHSIQQYFTMNKQIIGGASRSEKEGKGKIYISQTSEGTTRNRQHNSTQQ